MNNKIKIIALLTCIILLFSLPAFAAHKKVVKKKVVTPPPIEFNFISLPDNPTNPDRLEETCIIQNSIGTPELRLYAVNTGKKRIISFEFITTFLDSFNEPVRRLGSKSTQFKGVVQNTSLLSETIKDSGDNGQWYSFNLALYELATQVKMNPNYAHVYTIKLTRVKFSDGTIWKP